MSKAKAIIKEVLFWGVILAVLAGAASFALNTNPDKTIFGYRAYQVLSGSMSPTIEIGDMVIVKETPAELVQKGDIITYFPTDNTTTVTHRVIGTFLEDGKVKIETQGDAVPQPDPPFDGDRVFGVVAVCVPRVGGAIGWMQQNMVLSIAIVVGGIALCILISFLREKNKHKSKE